MGRKARMAISVAPSRGMAVFCPMEVSASRRDLPILWSTRMPSTMTMALSTSMPIARMKLASDTRCKVPSKPFSTANEPNTITTRLPPMMTPLFSPMKKMSTTTTMSTDSSRFTRNVLMAELTRSGWKNTLWHSTPAGIRRSSCSTFRSTTLPTFTMSNCEEQAIEMPRARWPS